MKVNQKKSKYIQPTSVDLVVIMDTSDSMQDEAKALSSAVEGVVEAARTKCPSDLRVCWLGIEGTWPGTKFTQPYRDYLHGLDVRDEQILGTRRGTLPYQGAQEEGAAAIVDVSNYFDWRQNASRLVLFLGDEPLKAGLPQTDADIKAADQAIEVALARSVKVFTYIGTKVGSVTDADHAEVKKEYARLAAATGGRSYEAPLTNIGGFETVLAEIICDSAGGLCKGDVELPRVRPHFELDWGDGEDDQIETDGIEVLCIVASNPYSNIVLKDVTVFLSALTRDGDPLMTLPDGTSPVVIVPSQFICFGDLPPCDPAKPEELTGIKRELVLASRGAIPGQYQFSIECCYRVESTQQASNRFTLNLAPC